MTNYKVKTIDEFIAQARPESQLHLETIRAAVKSALPDGEETISYGKPYFKYHGYIAGFDTHTHHINFELWIGKLADEFRDALEAKGYKTGSRTFQIRYDQKVPVALIKKMVATRAKEAEESE